MKKWTTLASALALAGCATMQPYSGEIPVKVIEVDATAEEIFQGSRQWIAENFQSADAVIQYQDESTNTVIGRGMSANHVCYVLTGSMVPMSEVGACFKPIDIEFVFKVEAKDGRMRVSLPTLNEYYRATGSQPASIGAVQAGSASILGYGDDIAAYIISGKENGRSW